MDCDSIVLITVFCKPCGVGHDVAVCLWWDTIFFFNIVPVRNNDTYTSVFSHPIIRPLEAGCWFFQPCGQSIQTSDENQLVNVSPWSTSWPTWTVRVTPPITDSKTLQTFRYAAVIQKINDIQPNCDMNLHYKQLQLVSSLQCALKMQWHFSETQQICAITDRMQPKGTSTSTSFLRIESKHVI